MLQASALCAAALSALVVFLLFGTIFECRRHAARARQLGCKQPSFRGRYSEPTGLVALWHAARAVRQRRFPDFIEESFEVASRRAGRPVGTVLMSTVFCRQSIFTLDPEIKAMLATQFQDFALGVNRTDNFKPLLGEGIFAANGDQWAHSRALLRPQFVRSQVSDLELEERHVQAMMSLLERRHGLGGWTDIVDLQPLFFCLTLDSATEFLFGESINSQLGQGSDSPSVQFAEAFDRSQSTLSFGARLGPHYWLAHTARFRRRVQTVHSFVDYFVQLAMNQCAGDKAETEKGKYVFLDALARETRDPTELCSQLLNILLASRDTTASSLSWFFFTMADGRYQHVWQRLRNTIIDEFGTYSNPRGITFERLKGCQYLQWCINESLRLYPVVPVNVRTAQVDTTLPVGGGRDGKSPVYVKKGQDVAYAVHVMHRRRDLWGPDADLFVPERWNSRRSGWDYLPFNGGPRICISQQFALTEIAYVVIRLMQRIDAIDGSTVGPLKHGLTITNRPADGVKVRLRFAD